MTAFSLSSPFPPCLPTHSLRPRAQNTSSKASLLDDDRQGPAIDAVSAIFTIMRDYAHQRGLHTVDYNVVELMVLKKGYTQQQLQDCLAEYGGLGVLSMDAAQSRITIDS